MKRLCQSRLAGLSLVALIISQMLTIAVIPSMVFQPLNVEVSDRGLSAGVFVSVYSLTTLVGGLLAGKAVDRYGSERILLVLLPLLSGVYLLYLITHSTEGFLTVRVLNGILFAFVVNGFVVLVRRSVLTSSNKIQARIHGVINSLNTVGSGIAMYFGVLLTDHITWLWLSVVIIGWMVVILVYWAIFVSSFIQMTIRQLLKKTFASASRFTQSLFVKEAFFAALPDVGMSSVYWAFLTYFALYKRDGADVILLMCTMAYGFSAITVLPMLVTKHKKMVIGWSISVCVLALILISMAGSFLLLLAAGVLIGIALAGSSLGILEQVNHSVDKRRLGAANATASFLRQLGAIIGPSYAGLMWSALGKTNMWLSLIPLLLASLVFLLRKQESQNTEVEFSIVRNRLGAFSAAQSKWPLPGNTLTDYARAIYSLQTGEDKVHPLEENAEERLPAWRVWQHCQALIAMESVHGFAGLSLSQEIWQVEKRLYGLLREIEAQHLHKYYNALVGSWGTEDFTWDNDTLYGPAYWAPDDNPDKIMASLKRMIEKRVKLARSLEEAQRHLSAVQALELVELGPAFKKCEVEDQWNTALQMATI